MRSSRFIRIILFALVVLLNETFALIRNYDCGNGPFGKYGFTFSPTGENIMRLTLQMRDNLPIQAVGFFNLRPQSPHYNPDAKSAYFMFWTSYIWVNGYSSAYFSSCDPSTDPNCYVGKYKGDSPYRWYGVFDKRKLPPPRTPVTVEASMLYDCKVIPVGGGEDLSCRMCNFSNTAHVPQVDPTTAMSLVQNDTDLVEEFDFSPFNGGSKG